MDGAAHHAAGGGGQLAQVLLLLVLHIKVSLSRFVNTIIRETVGSAARLESDLRRSGQSALRGQLGEILGLGPLLTAARAGLGAGQLVRVLQSPHQHPSFCLIQFNDHCDLNILIRIV